MTIPVSMPKLLGVGLLLTAMLTALLGIYSIGVTLFTGLGVGLPGLTGEVVLHGGVQIVTAAVLLMSGRKKEMKPGKRKNGRGEGGKPPEKLRGDSPARTVRLGWILYRSGKNIQDFIQYDILCSIAAFVIFGTGLQSRTWLRQGRRRGERRTEGEIL